MRFKIDGKSLKDATALVDVAVNPKSEVPDESHVFLMTTGQGTLFLVGQNDRHMVRVSNISVTDDEEGMVLMHASFWEKLINAAPGHSVEFESDDATYAVVRLFGDGNKPVKFNFNAMAADQYVPLALPGGSLACKVDKLHLRDGLRTVRPTADSDNSLDIANGVCFEFDGEEIYLVATDMSTLGYAKVQAAYNGTGKPSTKQVRVIPREALDTVERMLSNMADSDVELRYADTLVSFTSGNVEVVSKIMANGTQYIDWQRIVPTDIDGSNFSTTVGSLIDAMVLAEVVNGGDPVSVDFELADGSVVLASTGLGGTHDADVSTKTAFGEGSFRLDSKLIRNALRSLDGATELLLTPVNSGKQLQVTPTLPNLGNDAFQIWGTKTRKKESE